jgi:ubiquinone biosynthesis protein
VSDTLKEPPGKTRGPDRARQALERLGPMFVKLGQFLAMRPDLIPQEYCDEFGRLTDNVAPFPFGAARRTIEGNLGRPLKDCFLWIDEQPLAAGSLAQVHPARTHGGDEVVVKVQRPGAEASVRRILARSRPLARVFQLVGVKSPIPIAELLSELGRWLLQELNFQNELNNLERLGAMVSGSGSWYVPRAYPELSGTQVLTMELLKGVPVSHLLRLERRNREDRFEALAVDKDELSANLCNAVLDQIFRHRFFHADVHAGNLIALDNNRVGFVDAALASNVDATLRAGMARFLAAMANNDVPGMLRGLTDLLTEREDSDIDRFRRRFLDVTRTWIQQRDQVTTSGDGVPRSVRAYMVEVLRATRENRYAVPAPLLALYRSLLGAETIAIQLDSPRDIARIGRRFFRELQIEQAIGALQFDAIVQNALSLIELLKNMPARLDQVLDRLANDNFVVRVRQSESALTQEQANARARLVSASILAVAAAVLIAGFGTSATAVGFWLRWVSIAVGVLLAVRVAMLWRALR